MDHTRFGLTRRPFRPSPAVDAYVPLAGHDAAVSALRGAFTNGDGLAVLDGGPGLGKTLVALRAFADLGPTAVPVIVPAARFARPAELYQSILFDLGQGYTGLGENELRLAVSDHLLRTRADGKRAAVVLDEAHHLGPDLLEEMRLLDNLEAAFVLLVGPPELRANLQARPALAQRVRCRPTLLPLNTDESGEFLRSQLRACGGDPDELLPDDAAGLLAAHAGGVPRVLNQLAAAAFDLAAAAGGECVDVEAVYEALSAAGVEIAEPDEPARPAYPAGAARSTSGTAPLTDKPAEPPGGRGPKQPARKRRPA